MNTVQPSIDRFYPDGKEPVFAAPWEAHAFALTIKLYEQGLFNWSEWSDQLAQSIRSQPMDNYYENWLLALETLVIKKGIVASKELSQGVENLRSEHEH